MSSMSWSLSRTLLVAILDDRLSDRFVSGLVWERLGYLPLRLARAHGWRVLTRQLSGARHSRRLLR